MRRWNYRGYELLYPGRTTSSGTPWLAQRPASGHEDITAWIRVAKKMLRTDPKLAGYAMSLLHALLAADWYIEDGGANSAESFRNAEFIRSALGLEGHTAQLSSGCFETEIAKVVDFCLFGFKVVEEVYVLKGDYVFLAELGDIDQESLKEWIRNPDTDELEELTQYYVTGQEKRGPLPARKAQIYTLNKIGDDYYGRGLLEACLDWFNLKQSLLDSLAIGSERWSLPTPLIMVDRNIMESNQGYTLEEIETMIQKAQEMAESYLTGEKGMICTPAGLSVSMYGGTFDPTKIVEAIRHCDTELASAFLTNFLELGIGDIGTRSVGQVQWNAYKASIANHLDVISAVWNGKDRPGGGTIERLLTLNFYPNGNIPPSVLPRLAHRGVAVDGLMDSLNILPQLIAAGVYTPDDETEKKIRRDFGVTATSPVRDWPDRVTQRDSHMVSVPGTDVGGRPKERPEDDAI